MLLLTVINIEIYNKFVFFLKKVKVNGDALITIAKDVMAIDVNGFGRKVPFPTNAVDRIPRRF